MVRVLFSPSTVKAASLNSAGRMAGFTLLEVMVAIAISAVVAVLAYQGLSSASAGAERSREILTQINELDRAWQIFAADMRHVLAPELGP